MNQINSGNKIVLDITLPVSFGFTNGSKDNLEKNSMPKSSHVIICTKDPQIRPAPVPSPVEFNYPLNSTVSLSQNRNEYTVYNVQKTQANVIKPQPVTNVQCFDLTELNNSTDTIPYRCSFNRQRRPTTATATVRTNEMFQQSPRLTPNINGISETKQLPVRRQRPATTTGVFRKNKTTSMSSGWCCDFNSNAKLNIVDMNDLFKTTCLQPMKYSGYRMNEMGYLQSSHMNTKIFDYHEYSRRQLGYDIRRPRTAGVIYSDTSRKTKISFAPNCFNVKKIDPQRRLSQFRY